MAQPGAGDYVVCPWPYWKFHRLTGLGVAGYDQECVPVYAVKVERSHVYIDLSSAIHRTGPLGHHHQV